MTAGITNRFDYPMIIETIAEKTLVFKVKWQPKWKSFSVVSYKGGDAFVNQISSKFPIVQVPLILTLFPILYTFSCQTI